MTQVHVSLNQTPRSDAGRSKVLDAPVFGQDFTDHVVTAKFCDGGWGALEVAPFGPMSLSPAALALHYGQSIFEALKAYRLADGSAALFRPDTNAARMDASARRMAMPELPPGAFELACALLVEADRKWIPTTEGAALYVRPYMFASEPHLSVRSANEYVFAVIASPVASYFSGEASAISVAVESRDVRATPGGTGAAKFAGNYAAGFAAHSRAIDAGHDQVMWLDSVEHRWVEELNAMNVMFLWQRGDRRVLTTPPLTGTILEGVTRSSLLSLASNSKLPATNTPSGGGAAINEVAMGDIAIDDVVEGPTSVDMIRAGLSDGTLVEMFACGTAAVIAPIGRLELDGTTYVIGDGGPGPTTLRLRRGLFDIQYGLAPDPFGWMHDVGQILHRNGVDPKLLH